MSLSQMKLKIFLIVVASVHAGNECIHRSFGNDGTVCVCNATHCDFIGPIVKPEPGEFLTYTSNLAGLRFDRKVGKFQRDVSATGAAVIDHSSKLQKIIGFGGAFTDSTGININSLDIKTRDLLMRSYFSEDGLEYNLCRVPIGGTDFSTHSYSYDDGDEDIDLRNFKLAPEDHNYKIPLIKTAQNLTRNKLRLLASAWTAPKWMKTNGKSDGMGLLKPTMYQAWANYHIKFLDAYKNESIDYWGITTGNEPVDGLLPMNRLNDVGWTADLVSIWISQNLGPSLRNSSHAATKLMMLDDQRVFLPWFVFKVLKNNLTDSYIDGIAVHWYLDSLIPAITLTQTHNAFPGKFILGTEACTGAAPFWTAGVVLGSWKRGEQYASDIIQDLQHWVTGWVDWNMALNTTGGPTYINNRVDSPIVVNATSGEFYKQPMFYAMGHFSKFLPVDSARVAVSNAKNLKLVAFERVDNGTAIVVLNDKTVERSLSIFDKTKGKIKLKLSPKSFTTIIYW